jgi:hypothetical protein
VEIITPLTVLYYGDHERLVEFLNSKHENFESRFKDYYLQEYYMHIAVIFNGLALRFASKSIQDNKDIVKKAVYQDGRALEYASPTLKQDIRLVKLSVCQRPENIIFGSASIFEDVSTIKEMEDLQPEVSSYLEVFFKDNRNVHRAAICWSLRFFGTDTEDIRNDPIFMAQMIQKYDTKALDYVGEQLLKDRAFAVQMVPVFSCLLSRLDDSLKDDDEIVRLAVTRDPLALKHASQRLRQNQDLVLFAVEKNFKSYSSADPLLTSNREFALSAVQRNGLCLSLVQSFASDPEFVAAAAKNNGESPVPVC